jgi:hypothetical protein
MELTGFGTTYGFRHPLQTTGLLWLLALLL